MSLYNSNIRCNDCGKFIDYFRPDCVYEHRIGPDECEEHRCIKCYRIKGPLVMEVEYIW